MDLNYPSLKQFYPLKPTLHQMEDTLKSTGTLGVSDDKSSKLTISDNKDFGIKIQFPQKVT